jgi:predicted ABC-type ATPase
MMREAKGRGYEISLIYVGIDDVETNISRVTTRVFDGGHNVPEDDIRRRYERSIENLPKAIDLADNVSIYDNSTTSGYQRVLTIVQGNITQRAEVLPTWLNNVV